MPTISLTAPQDEFVHATDRYPAFVAGYGSGKSHAAICRLLRLKLQYPAQDVAYYMPTYDLITRMAMPRFEDMMTAMALPYKLNKNEAMIELEGRGKIIMRTMDNPARIVAYEVADSLADELDVLPTDKAADVWRKIMARNRQKKPDGSANSIGVATTPEGFRFVYEKWHKKPLDGYRLIKASTYSNRANLPVGYIEGLEADYPANLAQAYLQGEFVNLTSGSVYVDFDRTANASSEQVQPNDPLHIGLDFNVGKMFATVNVVRGDCPHAVDEFSGVLDTPAMINTIKARYGSHQIMIYPDASGNSRKSNNASTSDIALLRQAGFTVLANASNPAVKDRVLAMSQMIHCNGERRMFVNPDKCPLLVEALEKQAYDKNGEPDKTGDLDHPCDAQGYFISYRYPIRSRAMQRMTIGGI